MSVGPGRFFGVHALRVSHIPTAYAKFTAAKEVSSTPLDAPHAPVACDERVQSNPLARFGDVDAKPASELTSEGCCGREVLVERRRFDGAGWIGLQSCGDP